MKKIFTLIAAAFIGMTASAQQTWDFTVLPTQACDGTGNLICNLTDTDGKISDDPGTWSAFQNKGGIKDGEQLTVKEGEIFTPAAGLTWGILDNDKMILFRNYPTEYGGMHLYFNKDVDVTIPAKAGQVIEVVLTSAKDNKVCTSTGISEGIAVPKSNGNNDITGYAPVTVTVTEDNPVITFKSAVYVQKITVKKAPVPGASWTATAGEVVTHPDDDTKTVTLGSFTGEGYPAGAFSALDMTVDGANTNNGYVRFVNGYKGGNTGVDFVAYYPAVSKEPVTVTFTGTIASGVTFKPTKVGLNAARVGTDGGLMTISFIADGNETILIEDMIPARNNKETADDSKNAEEKFCAGRFEAEVSGTATQSVALKVVCNGLADNKQYALGDVVIMGTAEGVSGIDELTVINAGGAAYNLAGQRMTAPVRGQIYIQNGRKYIAR